MPEPTYQELVDLVASQAELIEKLTARVAELERRLGADSSNSSRPPSSDSPYTKKVAKAWSGLVLGLPPQLRMTETSAITAAEGHRIMPLPSRGHPGDRAALRVRDQMDLRRHATRLRPKPSRSGTATGSLPEFLSFDGSPRALDRRDINLQHRRRSARRGCGRV